MGRLELKQTLFGHTGRVWTVSWHPKHACFASCGEDRTIRIWAPEGPIWTNKIVLTEGHRRTIRSVAWSPCGRYLASTSFDGTTCIWDKTSGEFECNATLEGHENEVKCAQWSASGQFLATCSRDKTVWVWEVAEEDEYDCAAVLSAHTQDVKRVVWHPHESILASCSYDNTIKFFREDPSDHDWISCGTLKGHESTVWSLTWDESGEFLASCSDDCTIKIWRNFTPNQQQGSEEGTVNGDIKTAAFLCVATLNGYHTRTIFDIDWNKKNGLLASASADDSIQIFRMDNLDEATNNINVTPIITQVAIVDKAHSEDVNSVTWCPTDPNLLLTCSDDGDIKLWHFID